MEVLITGATGFLGGHICNELVGRGHSVRAVYRHGSQSRLPRGVRAVPIADLRDRASLAGIFDEARTLIHLAAQAHVAGNGAGTNPYWAVNVDGTANLLAEASAAGVTHVIFKSSIAAEGEPPDAYGESKLAAESLVRDWVAGASGRAAALLRAPGVYGPGMKGKLARLHALVERGVPLPVPARAGVRSYVYVGNLAHAVAELVERPAEGAPLFYVTDDDDLSSRQLIAAMAAACGRRPRSLPVPNGALRLAAGALRGLERVAGHAPVEAEAVERLLEDKTFDSGPLWRHIGSRPPFTVAAGLERTCAGPGA